MTNGDQHWHKSRHIVERIIVKGDLELETPAHFGAGEAGETADMSLLRDSYDGSALLPGASIAGALRNYWRERTRGYGAEAEHSELFGARRGRSDDEEGEQSLLIVDDARAGAPQVELRDGVSIDGTTRTAERGKLFDIEVLRAGTRFELSFELLIPCDTKDEGKRERLGRDLALALEGFERGEIGLGARKRRGLGRCRVREWCVWRYDLRSAEGLLAWLVEGRPGDEWAEFRNKVPQAAGESLAEKLDVGPPDVPDARDRFELTACFQLDGTLLVRSGAGESDRGPDAVHLHRTPYRAEGEPEPEAVPVLPGTSLAGALRARALRIANTLSGNELLVRRLIHGMFGAGPEDLKGNGREEAHQASRLVVHEAVLQDAPSRVQTRIRVDRFTGGAMDNYLFSEAPVFGGDKNEAKLQWLLRQPKPYEIGLLLLLLKDLWTGDLTLGGESGVGRGCLRGRWAQVKRVEPPRADEHRGWSIELRQTAERLELTGGEAGELEGAVKALNEYLAGRYVEQ
jgi:CRISPR/Cas system CSM-associated protein Csm3 (group 7 of RAMP superfamily)